MMEAPQFKPASPGVDSWGGNDHNDGSWNWFAESNQVGRDMHNDLTPYATAQQISVTPMTELTPPSGSSDPAWTPPYGDFGLPSPLATLEAPSLFPSALVGASSQAFMDASHELAINNRPQFKSHPAISTYGGGGIISGAAISSPASNYEQPPSEAATAARPRASAANPPLGISARSWRTMTSPEKCPECDQSFPYKSGLSRHIAARHPEVAARYDVSTERHVCPWCRRSFARKDHLTRHLVRSHGRPKGRRRRT